MSLITRCPHCKTVFIVHDAQVQKRAGRVRCGICKQVFNCLDNLIGQTITEPLDVEDTSVEIQPEEQQQQETIESPVANPDALSPNPEAEKHFQEMLSSLDLSLDTPEDEQPTDTTEAVQQQPIEETPPVVIHNDEPQPSALAPVALEPIAPVVKKKSRPMNWVWGIGSIVLFVVLCVQCIYFYGNTITAWWPPAKDLVNTTCDILECPSDNSPAKRSSLILTNENAVPVEGVLEHYTQKITLTNVGNTNLKWPTLRQEIRGTNGQALARHTITPAQYLPTQLSKTAAIGVGMSTKLEIHFEFAHNSAFTSQISIVNPPTLED